MAFWNGCDAFVALPVLIRKNGGGRVICPSHVQNEIAEPKEENTPVECQRMPKVAKWFGTYAWDFAAWFNPRVTTDLVCAMVCAFEGNGQQKSGRHGEFGLRFGLRLICALVCACHPGRSANQIKQKDSKNRDVLVARP